MSVMRVMETLVTEKPGEILGDNGNYPEKIRQHAVYTDVKSGDERTRVQLSRAQCTRLLSEVCVSRSLSHLVSFELRAV